MSVIDSNNFTGKYEVHISTFTATKIQEYIDRYETIILIELFGKELYDLYVAGLVAVDPIYETLRDAFIEQLPNGCILESRGVVDMLTGMIYFYYVRDQYTQMTTLGAVKSKGENSENTTFVMSGLNARWNEALDTYEAIQYYIEENLDVYPTYLGVKKHPVLAL